MGHILLVLALREVSQLGFLEIPGEFKGGTGVLCRVSQTVAPDRLPLLEASQW